jgi:hypothetical protein
MRTTYGLIQALTDYDFKNYVGNKKYDAMDTTECLVHLFHNFQQYQSWKVSDKEDPRFTPGPRYGWPYH